MFRTTILTRDFGIGIRTVNHAYTLANAHYTSSNHQYGVTDIRTEAVMNPKETSKSQPKESKKHHFVPRSLLKYFSINKLNKNIYVYDKKTGSVFSTGLMEAGSQNYYNTVGIEQDRVNYEDIFKDVDGTLATLLRELHDHRDITKLSDADRIKWAEMIATQLIRTPIMRTSIPALANAIKTDLIDRFGPGGGDSIEIPSEEMAKAITINMFLERDSMVEALIDKDFILYEAKPGKSFIISDQPVIQESTVPYGDTGLKSPGVVVLMPIGFDLMIMLMCKTVRNTLNNFPLSALPNGDIQAIRLKNLYRALNDGKPIAMDAQDVEDRNRSQVTNSSRFLYASNENDFDVVSDILNQYPQFKFKESNLSLGKMGQGPGISPHMPEGKWLVLYGASNHYMLEVINVSPGNHPVEMTITDVQKLKVVLKDGPFKEMRYYEDKQQTRSMLNVEVIELKENGVISISHSDPAIGHIISRL